MEPTLSTPSQDAGRKPLILSRSEHPISRSNLGDSALRVLYRLSAEGHRGYLVGGGVRDLFLGKTPKDFDVATDARPARIKKVFRNSRIIGRRFRIAHVYFPDGAIIEVSTFRRGSQQTIQTGKGTILRDNEYGTPEEDALRRDLTINGLFYDIDTFSVIDFVGGVEDLKNRIVRTINDPDTMLDRIMGLALKLLGAERGLILMFPEGGGQPRVAVARNASAWARMVSFIAARPRPGVMVINAPRARLEGIARRSSSRPRRTARYTRALSKLA